MFIFIWFLEKYRSNLYKIYIPLCLYLYRVMSPDVYYNNIFTFHYVYIYIGLNIWFAHETHQFTFHYVYIYMLLLCAKTLQKIFTFHYVYIYIFRDSVIIFFLFLFTFHYVYIYINLGSDYVVFYKDIYIPLCLYLYVRPNVVYATGAIFTFHYVYIYIGSEDDKSWWSSLFTFHYVYIYMCIECENGCRFCKFTFHYVYIYIEVITESILNVFLFTFHYVYIYIWQNLNVKKLQQSIYIPLCLYLYPFCCVFECYGTNLHSTMFIFISTPSIVIRIISFSFTFHYVYIYINKTKLQGYVFPNLHSTMFIFISRVCDLVFCVWRIYIPLCLYLYPCWVVPSEIDFPIYIPLCLYLYYMNI